MTPLKVLHVDDCDDVRTVVGLTLKSIGGMEVTQSASGPEAIEALSGVEADILLLDVMMPELSGPGASELPAVAAPVPRHAGRVPDRQGRARLYRQADRPGPRRSSPSPSTRCACPMT
jgi:DNA-binding NarL/FixJ family response regulator